MVTNLDVIKQTIHEAKIFPQGAALKIHEIGDGNVNYIYRILNEGDDKSVIAKLAPPYFKKVGPSHKLGIDRIRVEGETLLTFRNLSPDHVPEVFFCNYEKGILIMEDLRPMTTMRNAMLRMEILPNFIEHISSFLALVAFRTSGFYSIEEKRRLTLLTGNFQLSAITDELIFKAPYYDDHTNRVQPKLRPYLEKYFWPREDLRNAAAEMKYRFQNASECLQHGDLHTGSIFVDRLRTVVFDTEFAFIGPTGFDVGKLIGNLIINYCCWYGRSPQMSATAAYRKHITHLFEGVYTEFLNKLSKLIEESKDPMFSSKTFLKSYLQMLRSDIFGFAACSMIRRMFGLAQNIDVEGIKDLDLRRDVQIIVLELAGTLLTKRQSLTSIDSVTQMLNKI